MLALAAAVFALASLSLDPPSEGHGFTVISSHAAPDAAARRCLGPGADGTGVQEFEPSAAMNPRDPRNIVAAWMAGGQIVVARSLDGGRTWSNPRAAPFTQCSKPRPMQPALGVVVGDPFVAFGADGRAYVAALTIDISGGTDLASVRTAAVVITSADGGRTWGPPRYAIPFPSPEVKGVFLYDNVSVGTDPVEPGLVYVTSTGARQVQVMGSATLVGPAVVALSRDGGVTWSAPRDATPPRARSIASAPQVLALGGGMASIFYQTTTAEGSELAMVSSTDEGTTWGPPRRLVSVVPRAPFEEVETVTEVGRHRLLTAEDIVSVAADPERRHIYVAFADARGENGDSGARLGVHLIASGDGGATWSSPLRVSRSPRTHAYLPNVATNVLGQVGVSFLEAPTSPAGRALPVAFRLAIFAPDASGVPKLLRTRLVDAFDVAPTAVEGVPAGTGDYQGLVASGRSFVPIFVRTSCTALDAGCRERPHGFTDLIAAH